VATLLEILKEILLALPLPVAFAVLGAAAIGALLWLATFKRAHIWALGKIWLATAIRCILAFLMLELNLVPRLLTWWRDELLNIIQGLPPATQLAALLALMLFPFGVLGAVAVLVRAQDWFLNLFRESPLVVWRSRRLLVFGTLGAFVLCLLLKAFGVKGPLILFLLAAATSLRLVAPSLAFETTHQTFRRWVFPAVWLFYWGIASIGWRYSWLGLIFVATPTLLITGAWLFLATGALFPLVPPELYRGSRVPRRMGAVLTLDEQVQDFVDMLRYSQNREARQEWFAQRRLALRCLVTYALGTNYPYYVVIDEKLRYRTEGERAWLTGKERIVKRVEGDVFGDFLCGPGVVITGCDHAVVLSAGTAFKGAKGPGVVFTWYGDNPTQALDLRVQLRAFPVKAWTKDGIAVTVSTFVPFQIDTGQEQPELGKGFPYRSAAGFKAVQAQMIEHTGPSQMPEDVQELAWYDLPQLIGERAVRDAIARYEFDDLYAPFQLYDDESFQTHARVEIVDDLRKRLDDELPKVGLKRIGGGIGDIKPVDDAVAEQRIQAWKVDWMREVMVRRAEGQNTRLRLVEQARAQAQADIIMQIGSRITQMRRSGEATSLGVVLRYFIEVLEQLLGRSDLRELLPGDMDSILRGLRGAAEDRMALEGGE
jgi:regulator of protease activity HflC (stomatin/prohibitin superfamily)